MGKYDFIGTLELEIQGADTQEYGENSRIMGQLNQSFNLAKKLSFLPNFMFKKAVVDPLDHFLEVEISQAYSPPKPKPPRIRFWMTEERKIALKHAYSAAQTQRKIGIRSCDGQPYSSKLVTDLNYLQQHLASTFNPW